MAPSRLMFAHGLTYSQVVPVARISDIEQLLVGLVRFSANKSKKLGALMRFDAL